MEALYGLAGVVIGGLIALGKDWLFAHRQSRKEGEYLVVMVAAHLDWFVMMCADAVMDDGLSYGQRTEDGFLQIQTPTPLFEPEKLDVQWKALPVDLMADALEMPHRIRQANRKVSAAFEYAATPPDFSEGFSERSYQYAVLGMDAIALARRLREHSKLPEKRAQQWDPVPHFEEAIADYEKWNGI